MVKSQGGKPPVDAVKREAALLRMKHDPHLQKCVEVVASNIKERFAIFGNAFRYLDFKNRHGVSQEDFE